MSRLVHVAEESVDLVKQFNCPEGTEVVNSNDADFYDHAYLIGLDAHSTFLAFAGNEQDALDTTVDFCEKNDYSGLYLTLAEIEELDANPDDYVTAGNHSLYLDPAYLTIREVK